MSTDAMPHAEERVALPPHAAEVPAARLFLWSVRRELWEYRFLYWAPLVVGGLTVVGYVIATLGRALSTHDMALRRKILEEQPDFAAAMILVTAVLAGIFYLLDALQAERRDRSILFWKSLPVSDTLTDADGLGAVTYHWLRDGVDTGATGTSYVLGDADVGKKISVKATYTDGHGTAESVTSAETRKVPQSTWR